MHWPIIVVHHLSRGLMMKGMIALSKRKFTISEQTSGMMPQIIPITRKGFLILSNIEMQHIEVLLIIFSDELLTTVLHQHRTLLSLLEEAQEH